MERARHRSHPAGLLRRIVVGGGLAMLLFVAVRYVPTSARRPWDFETYWYAATASLQGASPYDSENLVRLAHRPVGMPFLYSPVTVPLLLPLTVLPIERAEQVWFALKALLLAALVFLWRRYFLPTTSLALLGTAAILGFNGAAVWDFRTGNVAIVEQALLWSGFAAYILERRRLFAACVVAASLFKLLPIAFLTLLLVPSRQSGPRWRLFLVGMACFVVLVFAPGLLGAPWASGFLANLPAERPWGVVNPSSLGIVDTILGDHVTPLNQPPYRAVALWSAYVALMLALSIPTFRRLWRRRKPVEWVMAGAIVYALVAPRMMIYSYLLVLVPVLVLAAPLVKRIGGLPVVVAVISTQAILGAASGRLYGDPWSANLPFLLLLSCWTAHLVVGANRGPSPAPPRARARERTKHANA